MGCFDAKYGLDFVLRLTFNNTYIAGEFSLNFAISTNLLTTYDVPHQLTVHRPKQEVYSLSHELNGRFDTVFSKL